MTRELLTHRNLAAYLMEAEQDLTVKHGQVLNAAGEVVAEVRRPSAADLIVKCCANCEHAQKTKDCGGNVRSICNLKPAYQVPVSPTHLGATHAGPELPSDLGLSYDIWT